MPTTTITTGATSFGGGVYLSSSSGPAIYAAAGSIPTLTNAGTLVSNLLDHNPGYSAVSFAGDGTVINTGTINGGYEGVTIHGVSGGGPHGTALHNYVGNSGTIYGVLMANPGMVLNQAGGTIDSGGDGSDGLAILLRNGGTVTNSAGATITGGVYLDYGGNDDSIVSSLDNEGVITTDFRPAVVLEYYGSQITNAGTIAGARGGVDAENSATLLNTGTILGTGTTSHYGVHLAGGTLTNQGSIGSPAWGITGEPVRVVNSGTITGGTASGDGGISSVSEGYVTNNTGGVISGYTGIIIGFPAATVTNAGTITGTGIKGVGIDLSMGGTVTNGGTIIGNGGTAVYFGGTAGSLLVVDPGAVFSGVVNGATSADNTLELASASGTGTLSGLGTSFANFGVVTVDSGAKWNLTGTSTIAASVTVNGNATLTNTINIAGPVTLGSGAALINAAAGVITNAKTAAIYGVGGAATVVNNGSIAGTGSKSSGVALGSGGSVTNAATASITGYRGVSSKTAGTVINAGTITGTYGAGIVLDAGGGITNSGAGVISGVSAAGASSLHNGIYIDGGQSTIVNSATINGVTGVAVFQGDTFAQTLIDSGTITGTGGTAVEFAAGNDLLRFQPGKVYIEGVVNGAGGSNTLEFASGAGTGTLTGAGAYFTNFTNGTVDAGASWLLAGSDTFAAGVMLTDTGKLSASDTLTNNGVILVSSASATLDAVAGSGSVTLAAGSTLATTGNVTASQGIVFDGGSDVLNVHGFVFHGLIDGFARGDTIALAGITDANGIHLLAGDTLEVDLSRSGPIDLRLQGDFTGHPFHYATVGHETMITVACFLAGTRIRTERGEIAVESLAIGERVITLSGEARPIKWIGHRAYDGSHAAVAPIRIAAGALAENVPARDLFVSPLHALFIDGLLIPAGELVNGVSITRRSDIGAIHYRHLELDSHDIILAEGTAVETFVDCDSREMFSNAAEFARLYPTDQRPRWRFCAPRVEAGPGLEQIRRRIERRSRRHTVAPAHGALLGNLEGADTSHIHGWACDPANPGRPVALEILLDDGVLARVEANRFRADLVRAKVGNGHHGFELRLSRPLSPRANHRLRVRRADDRRELPGSPLLLMAANVSGTR